MYFISLLLSVPTVTAFNSSLSLSKSNWTAPVASEGNSTLTDTAAAATTGLAATGTHIASNGTRANDTLTITESVYTTVCSTATTFICAKSTEETTYTITESTTLTISGCPCTFRTVPTSNVPKGSVTHSAVAPGTNGTVPGTNGTVPGTNSTAPGSHGGSCWTQPALSGPSGTHSAPPLSGSAPCLTPGGAPGGNITGSGSPESPAGPGSGSGITGSGVSEVTVVSSFTTYCRSSTELTYNGKTYTATGATTLTITNCPCTVTKTPSAPAIGGSSIHGGSAPASSVHPESSHAGSHSQPVAAPNNGAKTSVSLAGAIAAAIALI